MACLLVRLIVGSVHSRIAALASLIRKYLRLVKNRCVFVYVLLGGKRDGTSDVAL